MHRPRGLRRAAKGPARPVVGTVCGLGGCTSPSGFSLRVVGTPTLHRRVQPAPFVVGRLHVEPNDFLVGVGSPIVYVPLRGLWRVTIDGVPVWLDVPVTDRHVLRRAIRRLVPYPAPPTWAAVATG